MEDEEVDESLYETPKDTSVSTGGEVCPRHNSVARSFLGMEV